MHTSRDIETTEYASLLHLSTADHRILLEALLHRAISDAGDDGAGELNRYLSSMQDIYIQADLNMREFDCLVLTEAAASCRGVRDLESRRAKAREVSPMTDVVYETLLASRVLKETLIHQAAVLINGFLILESMATGPEANSRQAAAREIMNQLRKKWRGLASSHHSFDRLVMQDLAVEVMEHLQSFNSLPNVVEFIDIARAIVVEDAIKFEELRRAADGVLQAKSRAWKQPRWLAEAMKSLDLKTELTQIAGDRSPNSVTIRPSSGKEGNVTGNTFCRGVWAVTLDDGPHKTHTETIRGAFDRNGASGTFFWLARLAPNDQHTVQRVKNDGNRHTLANHSYTHANLPKLNAQGLEREIVQSTNVLEKTYGSQVRFFRCPYGACGQNGSRIRTMIANKGMIHVFWNVDSLDWQDKNPETILNRVRGQIENIDKKGTGGVVLFHDIHAQSATATSRLIDWMVQQKKFKLRSMDQVVDNINSGRSCD